MRQYLILPHRTLEILEDVSYIQEGASIDGGDREYIVTKVVYRPIISGNNCNFAVMIYAEPKIKESE